MPAARTRHAHRSCSTTDRNTASTCTPRASTCTHMTDCRGEHVTPAHEHGCALVSHPVALTQLLVPFTVLVYKSTSAARSTMSQPRYWFATPVKQLLDHTDDPSGHTEAAAVGTVPVNWLPLKSSDEGLSSHRDHRLLSHTMQSRSSYTARGSGGKEACYLNVRRTQAIAAW